LSRLLENTILTLDMAKEKITKKDVKKVGELCRLKLTKNEIDNFTRLFSDTLDYMQILEELDTSGIKETYHISELANIFQDIDNCRTLTKDEALKNANEVIEGMFVSEAVLERDD